MSLEPQVMEFRKETFLHEGFEKAINYCKKFGSFDDKQYVNCLRAYAINYRKTYDQYQNTRWRARMRGANAVKNVQL